MRLDRMHEEEKLRREGQWRRTLIQAVWLVISFVVAYFLTRYIFDQGVLTHAQVAGIIVPILSPLARVGLNPPATIGQVSQTTTLWATIVILVIFLQFFLYMGFILAEPEGRRHLGDATLHSRNKSAFDDERY